jgi:hypothetical protein
MIEPMKAPSSAASAPEVRRPELRRPPRHADESLTGTTRIWLRRLPAGRRPLKLCIRYPRVANRLAWCWQDPVAAEQVLEDLLVDRRGDRHGFPRPIELELRRLRDFNDHGRHDDDAGWWSALRRHLTPGA